MRSFLDVWLVAGFEIKRSIRTWRALALVLLYGIAATGWAYLVVQAIGAMEQRVNEATALWRCGEFEGALERFLAVVASLQAMPPPRGRHNQGAPARIRLPASPLR